MSNSITFDNAMHHCKILHQIQLNSQTTAYVVHAFEDGQHNKVLNLILHNNKTDQWFSMKLKAWRALYKGMAKRNFVEVRRMTIKERFFTKVSDAEREWSTNRKNKKKALDIVNKKKALAANDRLGVLRGFGIDITVDDKLKVSGKIK